MRVCSISSIIMCENHFLGKRTRHILLLREPAAHEKCAEYKLTMKDIPTRGKITIVVDRIGPVKHTAGVFKKRKCAGDKRVEAKREVKATAPSELYMARLADMSDTEIQAGNLTTCQSRDVLKTISSEGNKTDRLHDDVFMELVTAHYLYRDTVVNNKIHGYIQKLSYEPFYVICFLEEQIHVLRDACKEPKKCTLFRCHWDRNCTANGVKEENLLLFFGVEKRERPATTITC